MQTKDQIHKIPEPIYSLFPAFKAMHDAKQTILDCLTDICEQIHEEHHNRAVVVSTIMEATGCTYETAQAQYSRMKGILNSEFLLQDLRDGHVDFRLEKSRYVARK